MTEEQIEINPIINRSIFTREHKVIKEYIWRTWNELYIRELVNKRQIRNKVSEQDRNDYLEEAIHLRSAINYQDISEITKEIVLVERYLDWYTLIKEKFEDNFDYIPIEFKKGPISYVDIISFKPVFIEIYDPKDYIFKDAEEPVNERKL